MKISWKGIITLLLLASPSAQAELRDLRCVHFWKNGTLEVPSGKEVGVDVGKSPYSPDGLYRCSLTIDKADVNEGLYLYIGEVGDAAYIKLTEGPQGAVSRLPITHGLSPIPDKKSEYLRFLPFVVPLRDLYDADGVHKFEIHYLDIMPPQTGIRSGYPTIESSKGVLRRALLDSPGLTYHLGQTLIFLLFSVGVLAWRGLPWKNRLIFSACSLLSGSVIFSITAIPRFLLSNPWLAMRINDTSHLLALPLIFVPLLLFTNLRSNKFLVYIFAITVSIALISSLILWTCFSGSTLPYHVYAAILAIEGGVFPLVMAVHAYKGKLITIVSLTYSKHLVVVLGMLGLITIWDAGINLMLLDAKFPVFVVHFAYFLPALAWQFYLQLWLIDSQKKFSDNLEKIKNKTLALIGSDEGSLSAFDELAKMLAHDLHATRVSVGEFVDGNIKFLGTFGEYKDIDGLHAITSQSLVDDVTKKEAILWGTKVEANGSCSQYHLIPMKYKNGVAGVICVTFYEQGYLLPFIEARLETIQSQCQMLFSLLISGRDNKAQSTLLQMARLHVHPLQLKSEKYFLDHFRISVVDNAPAFIMGDLVDSTPLHELYGAAKIQSIIDQYLADIFDRFKELGLILSRTKGDEISIVFPNQRTDRGPEDVVLRAFEVIQHVVSSDELEKIARKNGVGIAVSLKFAASQADIKMSEDKNDKTMLAFSLMSDSQIDTASRVVSKVALPNECVLLSRVADVIRSSADVVQLQPERLKGIRNAPSLFLVNRLTRKKSA